MAKRSPEFPLCGNDVPGLRLRRRRLGAAPSRPHAAPAPQGGEARRRSPLLHVALALLLGATGVLHAQSRAAQLIDAARAQVSTHDPDSAAALLRVALDSTTQATLPERQNALVWQAIVAFLRGDEALSHSTFRQALVLDSALDVAGLDRLSPDRAEICRSGKRAAVNRGLVYPAGHLDEPPRRPSAPRHAWPPASRRRDVRGGAWSAAGGGGGRDSAAGADFAAGLELYERLTSRGVDLAPPLRRLADSVRLRRPASRRGRAEMAALQAVGVAGSQLDEQPAL